MTFDPKHILNQSERSCLNQDELSAYADRSLSVAEVRDIEMHILDCPVCSDAVDGAMDLQALEARKVSTSSKGLKWAVRIAALGLLVIGVVFAMNIYSAETAYESAFADAFVPYANDITAVTRMAGSNDDEVDSTVKKAMAAYDKENYQEALQALEQAIAEGSDEDLLPLYAAISEIQLGHYESALTYLDFVRVNDADRYEDVMWYTGLVHLKLNQQLEAKQALQPLVNESQYYSPRAQHLFEQAFGETLTPEKIQ